MAQQHDVVILGGGPAGSTAATILAQQGLNVVVLEKEHFPRFHIGESLLPATVRIFDRLGVHDRIRDTCIRKPGGKWLYGSKEVAGDFSRPDGKAGFHQNPYSYLVERSVFDEILSDRAAECGADVKFGCEVTDIVTTGDRLTGVRYRDPQGAEKEVAARQIIDATGLRSLIPSKLRLRHRTAPHRMGIYAQYAADPGREDSREGWFLGQMFYDGWTWLLRLPERRYSIGVVLSIDRFRRSGMSPAELLEHLVDNNELLNTGMSADRRRISDVMVTGHMGNTSDELAGEGWVTVGDAAYFIDPCYSSGVHLAMNSAEMVADVIAGCSRDVDVPLSAFDAYQREMRAHEKSVHRMVDAFYIASRNTSVQKLVTTLQGGYFSRKFVTFVGGDFRKNASFITRFRIYSKIVGSLFGNDPSLRPENSPDYLIDRSIPAGPAEWPGRVPQEGMSA
ncbi:MAG: NAD(P)/FAD-dependent oxidoreductase [Planctomycetaceae bacterium]